MTTDWTKHTVKNNGDTYITAAYLWQCYAPVFNFEYDEEGLLEIALGRGFVTETDKHGVEGRKLYKINEEY